MFRDVVPIAQTQLRQAAGTYFPTTIVLSGRHVQRMLPAFVIGENIRTPFCMFAFASRPNVTAMMPPATSTCETKLPVMLTFVGIPADALPGGMRPVFEMKSQTEALAPVARLI